MSEHEHGIELIKVDVALPLVDSEMNQMAASLNRGTAPYSALTLSLIATVQRLRLQLAQNQFRLDRELRVCAIAQDSDRLREEAVADLEEEVEQLSMMLQAAFQDYSAERKRRRTWKKRAKRAEHDAEAWQGAYKDYKDYDVLDERWARSFHFRGAETFAEHLRSSPEFAAGRIDAYLGSWKEQYDRDGR